jgi:ABC-type glycerol-3-phosphate transport system substrate-binding protein
MKVFFLCTLAVLGLASVVAMNIAPKAPAGKTILTWTTDDNPMRRDQIAPFEARYPQYIVDLDPSNAKPEKIIIQSIGGVGPDIFDCYDPFELAAYTKAGIAWDITDELKKRGIDINGTWPAVHADCVHDGRVYGFPTNAAVNGIWFHKEMFDEAGIAYPTGRMTWEEMIPIAQKLTQHDANGNITRFGLLIDWKVCKDYWNFIKQWNGHMYSADGTRCTLDSPECIAAIQFMYDLVYKYHVSANLTQEDTMATAGGWGSGLITLFSGKRGAMALGGRYWLTVMRRNPDLHPGAFECPHGPRRVFYGYGKATLINRNSPRREDALHWIEYENSEAYNKLINHQADGMGPVSRYTYTKDYLHDPEYPKDDFNGVWRDEMSIAEPAETSPFINGIVTNRIMETQLDLIKSNQKTPEQGMRDAARMINAEIGATVSRIPSLKQKSDALLAKGSK